MRQGSLLHALSNAQPFLSPFIMEELFRGLAIAAIQSVANRNTGPTVILANR